MSKRMLKMLLLVGGCASGCASESPEPENEEGFLIEEKREALYPSTVHLWPQDTPIPVCWENPTAADGQARGWVRDAVARTWEKASNLEFTGWGACTPTSRGIRILIADSPRAPHTDGLGKDLDGLPAGMTLNFTFQKWKTNECSPEDQRERCIRNTAVHEFGHALGFAHEHNRPDTPSTCTERPQGSDGDTLFGVWDRWSVLNYCNLLWDNEGWLSEIDEAGVRALYGTRRIANFGYENGTWRASRHLRMVADVNGDGYDDVVGFGDAAVIVSLAIPEGGFEPPRHFINDFAYNQGFRIERHVRTLADVDGDGRADVVAFGDTGVWLALSGSTRFYPPTFLADFGYDQGWRVDLHVRTLADVNGDGRADVVGFGRDGVWVAHSLGNRFAAPQFVLADFGYNQGWRVDQHVRTLADVNDDGLADIVGFGTYGVFVSLSTGTGFSKPAWFTTEFGANTGWRVSMHPRMLADVNQDGRADIVAFGSDGVRVALSGSVRFYPSELVLPDMGYNHGWRVDEHPRFVRDVSGDGRPDLVGFGAAGVYVATSLGGAKFGNMNLWALRYSRADYRLRNGNPLPMSEVVNGLGDFNGDGVAETFSFRANGLHVTDFSFHIEAPPASSQGLVP